MPDCQLQWIQKSKLLRHARNSQHRAQVYVNIFNAEDWAGTQAVFGSVGNDKLFKGVCALLIEPAEDLSLTTSSPALFLPVDEAAHGCPNLPWACGSSYPGRMLQKQGDTFNKLEIKMWTKPMLNLFQL